MSRRKLSPEEKRKQYNFRLNAAEKEKLDYISKYYDVPASKFIRGVIELTFFKIKTGGKIVDEQ